MICYFEYDFFIQNCVCVVFLHFIIIYININKGAARIVLIFISLISLNWQNDIVEQ